MGMRGGVKAHPREGVPTPGKNDGDSHRGGQGFESPQLHPYLCMHPCGPSSDDTGFHLRGGTFGQSSMSRRTPAPRQAAMSWSSRVAKGAASRSARTR